MRKLHVIVVPFIIQGGQLRPNNPKPAKSKEAGIQTAEKIASKYVGVGVYGVMVDDATYDASDLHEIARVGKVPKLEEVEAAAA